MSQDKIEKNFYTVKELADLLGISRVSVFKRVKQGSIRGQRLGRNFIILKRDINLKNLFKIVKTNKTLS